MKRAEKEAYERGWRDGMRTAEREVDGRIEHLRVKGHNELRDVQSRLLYDLLGELRRIPVPSTVDP